jgi:hypothetical protein
MATKRFGFGRTEATPSSRPSSLSASDSNLTSSSSILIGGAGGRGEGMKAEYPVICSMNWPARITRAPPKRLIEVPYNKPLPARALLYQKALFYNNQSDLGFEDKIAFYFMQISFN